MRRIEGIIYTAGVIALVAAALTPVWTGIAAGLAASEQKQAQDQRGVWEEHFERSQKEAQAEREVVSSYLMLDRGNGVMWKVTAFEEDAIIVEEWKHGTHVAILSGRLDRVLVVGR